MKKNKKIKKNNLNNANQANSQTNNMQNLNILSNTNKNGTISVLDSFNYVYDNTFILPSLQRDVVWKKEDIAKLFDSIYKGYPIGNLLLLKIDQNFTDEDRNGIAFYKFNTSHDGSFFSNDPAPIDNEHIKLCVLDGQQRLTAIYKGLYLPFGVKDKTFQLYFNALCEQNFREKMAFKYFVKDSCPLEDECCWLPLTDILNNRSDIETFLKNWETTMSTKVGALRKNTNKYTLFSSLKSQLEDPDEIKSNIDKLLNILKDTTTVYYNLITFDSALSTEEKISRMSDIFIRLNSGGKTLTPADLLYSKIALVSGKKNLREEFKKIYKELNTDANFPVINNFMRLVWLISGEKTFKQFLQREDLQTFMSTINFDDVFDALICARNIFTSKNLSFYGNISYNMFLPIAYYEYFLNKLINKHSIKISAADEKEIDKQVYDYFKVAMFSNYFSQHGDTRLTNITNAMKDGTDPIGLFKKGNYVFYFELLQKKLNINPSEQMCITKSKIEEFLNYDYNKNKADITKLLYLLYKDNLSSMGSSTTMGQIKDLDHMHPKSTSKDDFASVKDYKFFEDNYNLLPNLQLLVCKENRDEKNKKPLKEWLNNCHKKDLADYAINNFVIENGNIDLKYFDLANFETFYKKRKNIIEKKLKALLNV